MQNMPISRSEAISRSSVEVDNAVNEIVGLINRRLENFVEGSFAYVDMSRVESSLPRDIWNKAKLIVIDLYKKQGWKISYNSGSQRDTLSQFDIS